MSKETARIIDLVPYLNSTFSRKYRAGSVGMSSPRAKVYHTFKDCPKLGLNPITMNLEELNSLGYRLTKCKECARHE